MSTPPLILVIDDEPKNIRIMTGLLAEKYSLETAESGEEGMLKAQQRKPDLMLVDIMLPGIDGYEVCSKIRADFETENIPVIFVSAKDSLDERLRGYEVGGDDYFIKPFDHEELLVKVAKTLASQRRGAEMASRVAQANAIAMQAMTSTSELGSIIHFLESSFTAGDFDALAERFFDTTRAMGLSTSLAIFGAGRPFFKSDSGEMSSLEQSVLERAADKGRFLDFNHRTIVNFDHISLLIKNMPVDNPERYGLIKDNICHLLGGADARVRALLIARENERQYALLMEFVRLINRVLDDFAVRYKTMQGESYTIVEDMAERFSEVVPRLGLEEFQEKSIFEIVDGCVHGIRDSYDRSQLIDEGFSRMMKQLFQLSSEGSLSSEQLRQMISKVSG